jgi:putative toxin-antitoxin system antitoxin component (TIGR02293 family)
MLRRERSIGDLYAVPMLERMQLVRNGVPAALVGVLATAMGVPKETLYAMLQLPRATVNRKVRSDGRLGPLESERVIGLARLIGQFELIVQESGNPEGFDAPRWVASWLDASLPALGGERPASYMDTADGREIISGLVAQMQSGAYA